MLNVNSLVSREKFYFTDCIFIRNVGLLGYYCENNKLYINNKIHINKEDLTDIFVNSSIKHNATVYVTGEASAHGSCGFFYKKTNENIDWMLMSLASDPFISISRHNNMVGFLSSNGSTWTISDDDVLNVKIKKI